MAVTKKHAQYLEHEDTWKMLRDACAGEKAVKEAGQTYLPKKSKSQTDEEYNAYKTRAYYFNATGRTASGYVGLAFRRDPDLTYPESMQAIIDDVTLDGISFTEFSKFAFEEVVKTGRGGVLVDYPPVPEDARSLRDAENLGARPYATYYPPAAIINWDESRVNNRMMTTLVVLSERVYEADPADEFARNEIEQYRVLDLTSEGYRQRLFREVKNKSTHKKEWTVINEYYPKMNGNVLSYIPFEFLGPRDGRAEVQKSPIDDLARLNLSHYRTVADLENGRHWCGSPTPVFLGEFITADGEEVTEVKLGSESGIHIVADGDAKFLEFTGSGLEELREAEKEKREMMVVLGSRMLAEDKRQVEAAETARIHKAGEDSSLSSVVQSLSRSMTRVLEYLRDWLGLSDEVSCEINTDFVPAEMSPQELLATVSSWQQGALSSAELFERLQAGEIIRPTKTLEEHETELEAEPPRLGTLGGGAA